MTRIARALSELGHYHVMLKGCAGQLISKTMTIDFIFSIY